MPEEPTQASAPAAMLFASALRAREAPVRSRQRLLVLVLAVIGLHAAALLGLTSLWHGVPRRLEGEATHGEVLVLRLSAASPQPRRSPAPARRAGPV
ncbi:energy transducer TonB, partial [Myxococcus sp. 1LA]